MPIDRNSDLPFDSQQQQSSLGADPSFNQAGIETHPLKHTAHGDAWEVVLEEPNHQLAPPPAGISSEFSGPGLDTSNMGLSDQSFAGSSSFPSSSYDSTLGSSGFDSSNLGTSNLGSSNFAAGTYDSSLGSSNLGSNTYPMADSTGFQSSNLGSSNLGSSNLDSNFAGSSNLTPATEFGGNTGYISAIDSAVITEPTNIDANVDQRSQGFYQGVSAKAEALKTIAGGKATKKLNHVDDSDIHDTTVVEGGRRRSSSSSSSSEDDEATRNDPERVQRREQRRQRKGVVGWVKDKVDDIKESRAAKKADNDNNDSSASTANTETRDRPLEAGMGAMNLGSSSTDTTPNVAAPLATGPGYGTSYGSSYGSSLPQDSSLGSSNIGTSNFGSSNIGTSNFDSSNYNLPYDTSAGSMNASGFSQGQGIDAAVDQRIMMDQHSTEAKASALKEIESGSVAKKLHHVKDSEIHDSTVVGGRRRSSSSSSSEDDEATRNDPERVQRREQRRQKRGMVAKVGDWISSKIHKKDHDSADSSANAQPSEQRM